MLEFFLKPVGAALVGAALLEFQPGIANAQDAKPKDSETALMLRTMHGYLKTNDLAFRSQFSTYDKVLGGSRSGVAEFSVRGPNLFPGQYQWRRTLRAVRIRWQGAVYL